MNLTGPGKPDQLEAEFCGKIESTRGGVVVNRERFPVEQITSIVKQASLARDRGACNARRTWVCGASVLGGV